MFFTIAIVVGVLVAAILGLAATRPGTFRVERARIIEAPPEKLFGLIADFHNWAAWSPYEKLDPSMQKTFSGAASGKGAVYEWAGNGKAGQGRMEITGASPGSNVTIQLDFLKPFEGHNVAEFTLEGRGGATNVTWAIQGPQSYILKVMTMFCSMDKMLGKDFEAGLGNMKALAEE